MARARHGPITPARSVRPNMLPMSRFHSPADQPSDSLRQVGIGDVDFQESRIVPKILPASTSNAFRSRVQSCTASCGSAVFSRRISSSRLVAPRGVTKLAERLLIHPPRSRIENEVRAWIVAIQNPEILVCFDADAAGLGLHVGEDTEFLIVAVENRAVIQAVLHHAPRKPSAVPVDARKSVPGEERVERGGGGLVEADDENERNARKLFRGRPRSSLGPRRKARDASCDLPEGQAGPGCGSTPPDQASEEPTRTEPHKRPRKSVKSGDGIEPVPPRCHWTCGSLTHGPAHSQGESRREPRHS